MPLSPHAPHTAKTNHVEDASRINEGLLMSLSVISLPKIYTRTCSILKTMDLICICDYDLPHFNLRYCFCSRMAVSAHTKIFGQPDGSALGCTDQPKSYSQFLGMSTKGIFFVLVGP